MRLVAKPHPTAAMPCQLHVRAILFSSLLFIAAYHAVQEMFREQEGLHARLIPATVMALLVLAAVTLWYRGSRRKRPEEQAQVSGR